MENTEFLKSLGLQTEETQKAETTEPKQTETTEKIETTEKTITAETTTEKPETTEQTETTKKTETTEELSNTDYNKSILDKFGYNSIDDLLNSNAPDKIKQYDDLVAKIQALELENAEFMTEASNISNPFINEDSFKLNYLLKENPNLDIVIASKLLKSDIVNMSNIDKIKLAMQIENPDYSDSYIDRELRKKFDVDNISDLYSNELDADLKLDIDIEAKKALKVFDKYKVPSDIKYESTFTTDKIKEKATQKQELLKLDADAIDKAWMPIVADMENNFKEAPLPIFDSKNNKIVNDYVKFVLSDTERKNIANDMMNIARQFNIKEITPEIEQTVKLEVWKNVLVRNIAKIIQTASDRGASDEFARIKALRDGVTTKQTSNKKPDSGNNNNGIDVVLNARVKDWKSANI